MAAIRQLRKICRRKCYDAAENLEFERASEYRDQISHIEATMEKQKMMSSDFTDRDVFGYSLDKGWMCVQVFFIRQGKLIESDVSLFPVYREQDEEFLTFLGQFYSQPNHFKPKEILIPESADEILAEQLLEMKSFKAKKGQKKDLVKLAQKNAKIALKEKFALIERDEERTVHAIDKLGNAMGIYTPYRIEAFDNSNIQGADPVSALVVFINGKPEKKGISKV